MFIDSISHNINSIYKLLNKSPAVHSLTGSIGPIYFAIRKAKIFANTYEAQFTLIPGQDLPEVMASIQTLNSTLTQNCMFTTPGTVQSLIHKLPNRKAPGEDMVSNIVLNYPAKATIFLTRIFNSCLQIGYFPDSWKQEIIITTQKSAKDPRNLPHSVNVNPI